MILSTAMILSTPLQRARQRKHESPLTHPLTPSYGNGPRQRAPQRKHATLRAPATLRQQHHTQLPPSQAQRASPPLVPLPGGATARRRTPAKAPSAATAWKWLSPRTGAALRTCRRAWRSGVTSLAREATLGSRCHTWRHVPMLHIDIHQPTYLNHTSIIRRAGSLLPYRSAVALPCRRSPDAARSSNFIGSKVDVLHFSTQAPSDGRTSTTVWG